MKSEIILLIDSAEDVRDAVSHSLMQTGSYVEAVASCDEAIEFMIVFRPDWILVGEDHAPQLLLWLRSQEGLRAVPVVLLPDLGLLPPRFPNPTALALRPSKQTRT